MNTRRPVKRLSPDVARKIAAGEVIDRPCAVVRELMDNAIDSMATEIHVEVEGGGIEKIRIFDNGSGMTKEDLENCAHPHATSKIESEADLLNLSTLGFRGEALSSIAAVSRLSIISGSWKMNANLSGKHTIRAHANVKGTIVQVEGLFENFPARRNFLKRASAELNACKSMFIEKALSHPNITFTFTSDGEQKLNLLGNTTLRHRFAEAAFPLENESLFYEIKCNKYEDFQFSIIIGEPAISRTSKKDIFIFVNGRKINEYSLVQAIEYGAKGYFPNGTYPVASLFATVKPELVDFNIHPAKREARFQNIAELHHAISSTVKNFFYEYTAKNLRTQWKEENEENYNQQKSLLGSKVAFNSKSLFNETNNFDKISTSRVQYKKSISTDDFSRMVLHRGSTYTSSKTNNDLKNQSHPKEYHSLSLQDSQLEELSDLALMDESSFRFIGRALGTFIIIEKNNCLYFIDQHAAHERLIFDEIMNNKGKSQTLLVPYVISPESKSDDIYLSSIQEKLCAFGFDIKKIENGKWEVRSIHERWKGSEKDLQYAILENRLEPSELIRRVAAMTACRAAVKDGDILEKDEAEELAKKALNLPDPHCPHGRPVWTVISKEDLFLRVKRT